MHTSPPASSTTEKPHPAASGDSAGQYTSLLLCVGAKSQQAHCIKYMKVGRSLVPP